jgi:hypothetical protein
MRTTSRRTFWLRAATLLVAIVVCGWFLVPRNQVTRENFDRIQEGMSVEEVTTILGQTQEKSYASLDPVREIRIWTDGPSRIVVTFRRGFVFGKDGGYIKTTGEVLSWHFKRQLKKIEWE